VDWILQEWLGVFIGGAALGMPVVMDGFISCVSALIAIKICPQVSDHILASHVSKEPAAQLILKELGKEAIIMQACAWAREPELWHCFR